MGSESSRPPEDTLGALLIHLRGDRAVADVAAHVGVARFTVYHWESGLKTPTPENLGRLIALYKCDEATELKLWRLRAGTAAEPAEAVGV